MDLLKQHKASGIALIGGSSGSLDAIESVFKGILLQTGKAFVIIQHLSAEYDSHLDFLIKKWTPANIERAKAGDQLKANTIYLSDPGKFLAIHDGCLYYQTDISPQFDHHPIDFFCQSLESLADIKLTLVILSGSGNDGSDAARSARAMGGLVIVQNPESARFAEMPRNVIDLGLADSVLDPIQIRDALVNEKPSNRQLFEVPDNVRSISDQAFSQIILMVQEFSGINFDAYKPSTLKRRIIRRMSINRVPKVSDYTRFLSNNKSELTYLSSDFLIGVTAFFRDAEAFDFLSKEVIPRVAKLSGPDEPIRIWIAGCSTGEEAYSIAILFLQYLEQKQLDLKLQIFATDIDDAALSIAREGFYSAGMLKNLSYEMIQAYFEAEANGYRIKKQVREQIVFASHNLILDPPFSRLSFVVCRNLLIYLKSSTQNKLLGLFHFVLNSDGYLFLGSSESIGSVDRHFKTISNKFRIFQHFNQAPRRTPVFPIATSSDKSQENLVSAFKDSSIYRQERYFQSLIDKNGPVSILLDENYQLLFTTGQASRYLNVPVGRASYDFFKIANPSLVMPIRSAIKKSFESNQQISVPIEFGHNLSSGKSQHIRVDLMPVEGSHNQKIIMLVISQANDQLKLFPGAVSEGEDWVFKQLLQEMNATREDLQSTIENSRIANDEMRATNEEIMAMNEELQSANEELESSKEELLSLNDELASTNKALDTRVDEVELLNTDLTNLLQNAETATLLVDDQLRIRRYTSSIKKLMKIISSDVGRPMDDVVHLFQDETLVSDCKAILNGENVVEVEVESPKGSFYLRRLKPYRVSPNQILGVVINFIDISDLRKTESVVEKHVKLLQWQSDLIAQSAPILARDRNNRIVFWNKSAAVLYGWSESEALGQVSYKLLQTEFDTPLEQIQTQLEESGKWMGRLTNQSKSGERIPIDSQWTLNDNGSTDSYSVVEVNNDVRPYLETENALQEKDELLHTMMDWTFNWEYILNPEGEFLYMTPSVERITGYTVDDFAREPNLFERMVDAEDRDKWTTHEHEDVLTHEDKTLSLDLRINHKRGFQRWINHTCRPVFDEKSRLLGRRVTVRDITDIKEAEQRIKDLVNFDPLTHLPNRRLLLDRNQTAIAHAARKDQFCALLMLDLDNFKDINDTRGHDVGDRVLVEASHRLISTVRHEDTVARIGGDEFAVILRDLGKNLSAALVKVNDIGEKIRKVLSSPYDLKHEKVQILSSCSIGITLFHDASVPPNLLLKQADVALYQAKDAGRNGVSFFSIELQAEIDAKIALISSIQRAIDKHEFELFYQPQVNSDGVLYGVEGLIRWHQPDGRTAGPAQFMDTIEGTEKIIQIGNWVIQTGCQQLKAWQASEQTNHLQISINISPYQFQKADFSETLIGIVEQTGVDPSKLVIEITETAVLKSINDTVKKMTALIKHGIRFSLDDFGTGYSSLSYLKKMPIDEVKIDRSFVTEIPENSNDLAIVKAILAMTDTLGLKVIAEGVETKRHQDVLLDLGCVRFQGYLFAKPSPIKDLKLTTYAS